MDKTIIQNHWKIIVLDKVVSTMDELKKRSSMSNYSKLGVLAKEQTKGRGSNGRSWVSPKGNFYFSFIIKYNNTLKPHSLYVFVLSLIVCKTLEEISNSKVKPQIKWPNDILIGNKKLSGILIESYSNNSVIKSLVVGIGINLLSNPSIPSRQTTNLYKYINEKIKIEEIAKILLKYYDAWEKLVKIKGFSFVKENWLEYSIPIGSMITFNSRTENEMIKGRYQGVNDQGAIMIKNTFGFVNSYVSGEIFQEREN